MGEAPAGAPRPDNHQANDSSTLAMGLADCRAQVVVIRRAGWKVTFYTDPNPATGVMRDINETVRWITSRRAA